MSTDEYVPSEMDARGCFLDGAEGAFVTEDWEAFLARIRRDAWDACYHQMVTAPARGVTVTKKSNPYTPERRVTP